MKSKCVNQKGLKWLHSRLRHIVFRSDSWSSANILASSVDTSLPGSSSEWPWRQRAGADLTLTWVCYSLNFNPRTLLHFKRPVRNMARLHYEKINCLWCSWNEMWICHSWRWHYLAHGLQVTIGQVHFFPPADKFVMQIRSEVCRILTKL